jgi:hypothetical protein
MLTNGCTSGPSFGAGGASTGAANAGETMTNAAAANRDSFMRFPPEKEASTRDCLDGIFLLAANFLIHLSDSSHSKVRGYCG